MLGLCYKGLCGRLERNRQVGVRSATIASIIIIISAVTDAGDDAIVINMIMTVVVTIVITIVCDTVVHHFRFFLITFSTTIGIT